METRYSGTLMPCLARSRRLVTWACCGLVWGCGSETDASSGATGPSVQDIEGEPSCADCTIELRELVVLGGPGDPASARPDADLRGCAVGVLSSGEYVMSAPVGGGELLVYGPLGEFRRTIGRTGRGPGEFGAMMRVIVGPGDSLYVMDDTQGRIQVMTAQGVYVRGFRTPARFTDLARLVDGTFVFFRAPTELGEPLFFLLDATGEELGRFGGAARRIATEESWSVTPAPSGGFWSGDTWEYRVLLWNLSGDVERVVRRLVDWFPIPDREATLEGMYESRPPDPFLLDTWEDDHDRLWTYSLVPDPDWEPGISPRDMEWADRTFDMVVEVLDLDAGRAVVSRRIERLGRVCGSGLLYDVVATPEGDVRIRVLEPSLAVGTRRE